MPPMPRRALPERVTSGPLAALLLAAVALAGAPAPAPAQAVRYTRPVDVRDAGWVRVPLASEVVRRAGTGGGVRLFGPEGEEVPFARLPVPAEPRRRPAAPLPPDPAEAGWWLPLEVSRGARLHDLLVLSFEGSGPVAGLPLRLEASADGEAWQLLAVGEAAAGDGDWLFPYPATDLRFLRLRWPRPPGGGGPPTIAAAAVEEVPPGAFRVSVARPECRAAEAGAAPSGTVCRLSLGGTGRYLRRLCFVVGSEGAAGYRVLAAVEGRWEPVAEAVWPEAPADSARCALLDLALPGELEPLRLEVYGGGKQAPAVRDAAAGFAPEMLVFQARRAGLHTLAYGPAVFRSTREGDVDPPRDAGLPVVVPGPEEVSEVPASALILPTAAGPAPAVRFEERWDLTADAPAPGALHRLTLPSAVYPVSESDLADLRLLVSGAGANLQVPYVRWRPDEPELVAERRRAEPLRGRRGDGTSRLRVEVPEADLPLSALVASAPPGDGDGGSGGGWNRRVRVLVSAAGGAEEAAGPWTDWQCPPRPPLPCRATVPLEPSASGALVVEIDDGGGAPLPAVDLELWRRRDVLLFPWPAERTTPGLAAGAAALEAPEYDLSQRAEELVARPWREARVAREGAGGGRLGAAAITLALLAAAAALVVLLHRILGEQDPGRRRDRA